MQERTGKLTKLAFILTCPTNNSWNGVWSNEGKLFVKIRNISDYPYCKEGLYPYTWNDGWSVNIEVKKVTTAQGRELISKSSGFLGYTWMIDSIIRKGRITPIG